MSESATGIVAAGNVSHKAKRPRQVREHLARGLRPTFTRYQEGGPS